MQSCSSRRRAILQDTFKVPIQNDIENQIEKKKSIWNLSRTQPYGYMHNFESYTYPYMFLEST